MSPPPTFPIIVCRHEDYHSAGESFAAVRDNATDVHGALLKTLTGFGGMAGSDPAGTKWAQSYDQAVGAALQASSTLVSSCARTRDLLAAGAFNHASGEAAANLNPGQPPAAPQLGFDPCLATYAPSAAGGEADEPTGWSLIDKFVDVAWPNGHQDLLRAARDVWHNAADSLDDGTSPTTQAVNLLQNQQSPEIPQAIATCNEMGLNFTDLAGAYRKIGDSCSAYAQHLDDAHHQILVELSKMAAETAALEAVIQVAAPFTLGFSELGNGGVAARVAVYAGRISRIVAELAAKAGRLAVTLGSHISTSVTPMAARLSRWLSEAVPRLWGAEGQSALQLFSRSAARTNMDVLLNGGNKVPMTEAAVRELAAKAGIDLGRVDVVVATDAERARYYDYWGACGHTPGEEAGRQVIFAPSAFLDEDTLVATIAHEMTHVQQIQSGATVGSGVLRDLEAEAYASEAGALERFKAGG